MSITPIQSLQSFTQLSPLERLDFNKLSSSPTKNETENEGISFAQMLSDAVAQVNATDATTKSDAANLSLGTSGDDLHTIEINAVKAELALQTLISVRNKALEAYSEIMRITL